MKISNIILLYYLSNISEYKKYFTFVVLEETGNKGSTSSRLTIPERASLLWLVFGFAYAR